MSDPIEEEATALVELVKDWHSGVACGLSCAEQVRMLRTVATKADELTCPAEVAPARRITEP